MIIYMSLFVDSVHSDGGIHTECHGCGYGFISGDECFIGSDSDNNAVLICYSCKGED